jgi:hypothetical protein
MRSVSARTALALETSTPPTVAADSTFSEPGRAPAGRPWAFSFALSFFAGAELSALACES